MVSTWTRAVSLTRRRAGGALARWRHWALARSGDGSEAGAGPLARSGIGGGSLSLS